MSRILGYVLLLVVISIEAGAQVDTTFIHNNNRPYGSLDIRIAKSPTWYYYLQESKTFSFRESAPGVKTDTYLDMTSSWDSSPYTQGNLREKNGSSDSFVMNYRLLHPMNYNASYNPGYPLLLIMHGLGEAANCSEFECHHADQNYSPVTNVPAAPVNADHPLLNNDHHLTNGGNVHLKARNDAAGKLPNDPSLAARAFPGFVLFPQDLNGWNNRPAEDAIRIVRLICKKYNIDENRVYIHGLSNGGHGVYEVIKRAPWMFAAALTMSAIDDGFINNVKMAPAIAHIPLWVFQGSKDENPTPQKTKNYVKKFRDAGAVVRYTEYPDLGHGTWGTAYREPDFFTWILSKNKANIHTFSGSTTICGASGLKLELAEGYKAYQWQLNGQTISGATGASYVATAPGTYRARFSRVANPTEAQWNKWSDPVVLTAGQGIAQAQIKQNGTVLLNDLNNFTNARLEAVGTFGHYYWYKNGTLIDFPGDQDDTIKYATITPAMGAGAYTLVTSNFDNCFSPVSAAKHLFFNNQAPLNITAPGGFTGTVNGAEITLSWTDASANENGFEIWRRRKTDATNFTPWEMAALTAANVTSFKDAGLFPTALYQYKIRAVSSTGRSDYSPPAATVLELTTGTDAQAPSAPKNLAAAAIGVKKIRLTWRPSTDNTGIKDYFVYIGKDSVATNSLDTTFLITSLELNSKYTFYVRARDLAGNLSAPSNTQQGSTYISGLYYEHSTGVTFDLDSINWDSPEFTGVVPTFTLAPRTQEDYFNFRFDGYLLITHAGAYEFRTGSNDGSRLKLDDAVLVDNDGVHDFKIVASASRNLTAGAHRIMVDFFDYTGVDSLMVQYKGPDSNNEWSNLSADVLKSSDTIVTGTGPDNGPEDSFELSVYPNPSTYDGVNIKVKTVLNDPVVVEVIDPVGRRLMAEEYVPDQLRDGMRLPAPQAMTNGIYIVIVSQGKITARQRVIIRN
jgi:chitodextrinase